MYVCVPSLNHTFSLCRLDTLPIRLFRCWCVRVWCVSYLFMIFQFKRQIGWNGMVRMKITATTKKPIEIMSTITLFLWHNSICNMEAVFNIWEGEPKGKLSCYRFIGSALNLNIQRYTGHIRKILNFMRGSNNNKNTNNNSKNI